ncbi:MAG: hypothetical protein V4710_01240 [Verrucomicrobiota bacterium]
MKEDKEAIDSNSEILLRIDWLLSPSLMSPFEREIWLKRLHQYPTQVAQIVEDIEKANEEKRLPNHPRSYLNAAFRAAVKAVPTLKSCS